MSIHDSLTNEVLVKQFENPFQLVNAAIKIAKQSMSRGEEFEENAATEILEMLLDKKEYVEETEE